MEPVNPRPVLLTLLENARQRGKPGVTSIVSVMESIRDDAKAMVQAAADQALVTTATGTGLDYHAQAVLARRLESETEEQSRARIQETQAEYRPLNGTTLGYKKILNHLGLLRQSWVYVVPCGNETFDSYTITGVDGIEIFTHADDADSKFLVGRTYADGSGVTADAELYSWDGMSWVTHSLATEFPTGEGNTIYALENLTPSDWSDLLPCRGLFLVVEVSPAQQLRLSRFYARISATVE